MDVIRQSRLAMSRLPEMDISAFAWGSTIKPSEGSRYGAFPTLGIVHARQNFMSIKLYVLASLYNLLMSFTTALDGHTCRISP